MLFSSSVFGFLIKNLVILLPYFLHFQEKTSQTLQLPVCSSVNSFCPAARHEGVTSLVPRGRRLRGGGGRGWPGCRQPLQGWREVSLGAKRLRIRQSVVPRAVLLHLMTRSWCLISACQRGSSESAGSMGGGWGGVDVKHSAKNE